MKSHDGAPSTPDAATGSAGGRRKARPWPLVAVLLATLGAGAAAVYFALTGEAPKPYNAAPANFSGVLPSHASPRPLPPIRFADDRGRQLTLADFRGKVVLLNVWATWCPPCRNEMPALDGLQSKVGGPDFEVIAVSIDQGPQGLYLVQEFYLQTGVKSLRIFMDSAGDASRDLEVLGLPTSLLIDRSGREISRVVGPREWDSPEMVAAIRRYLASAARPAAEAS